MTTRTRLECRGSAVWSWVGVAALSTAAAAAAAALQAPALTVKLSKLERMMIARGVEEPPLAAVIWI
jgi:hypothetical protein